MLTPRTEHLIDLALEEDAGLGDITSRAIFPANHRSVAVIDAKQDLVLCGLVGRLQVETPEKHFIGGCRLCPYMKLNSLEKVRDALANPRPDQIVTLPEDVRVRAARCIERMFELAPAAQGTGG